MVAYTIIVRFPMPTTSSMTKPKRSSSSPSKTSQLEKKRLLTIRRLNHLNVIGYNHPIFRVIRRVISIGYSCTFQIFQQKTISNFVISIFLLQFYSLFTNCTYQTLTASPVVRFSSRRNRRGFCPIY